MVKKKINKSVIYIITIVLLVVLTLSSIGLATWAILKTRLEIGGRVTFNGTGNVLATISNGKINYKETSGVMTGFTMDETYDESANTLLSTWKNLDINFDEAGNDIPLTFTITNNSDEKTLLVEMTSSSTPNDNVKMEVLALGQPYEDRVLISPNKSVEYMLLFSLEDTNRAGALDNFSVSLSLRNAMTDEIPTPTLDKLKFEDDGEGGWQVLPGDNCEGDIVVPAEYEGKAVKSIQLDYTNITSIIMPEGVEFIYFEGCDLLRALTIPSTVISLGSDYFSNCTSLKSVVLNNGVKNIHEASYNCPNLRYINIPESVSTIDNAPFAGCHKLTQIVIDKNNPNFCIDNNVIFNKDKTELVVYTCSKKQTAYSIPTTVKVIGDCAFWGCTNLTDIIISSSVTSIVDYAFIDCSSLTSITIPARVTSIGRYAFSYCSSLTNITFQQASGSVEMGHDVFYNVPTSATVSFSGAVWTCGDEIYSDSKKPASLSALESTSYDTPKVWTITK